MQMRINPNKKVHKIKRDPYKVLAKLALILAVCVVAGVGIFYLCSKAVERDYVIKRDQIDQMNAENEVEFNTRLNEMRAGANNAFSDPISSDTADENLPSWEKTLDGKVWRVEDEGKTGLENVSTVTLSRSELLQGGLVLINPWHSVPSDYSYEGLLSVGSNSNYKIPVTDNTVQLFPAAYNGLLSLINRCTEAGYDSYIVRQGYRSNEEQTKLFEDAMQRLSSQYSGDILIEQTKKDVNYPGTSEYQSGFAFQMGLYNRDAAIANTLGKFSEDKRGQYFIENCWKDGIVFRFPVDGFPRSDWESKTYKTGISAKLLLFRYVGNAHAAVMRTMDYCLEEYLEFLIAHPHITVYEDGALRYEIYRISGAEGDSFTLPVPNPASGYQASLDNLGGVVLAYTYN